MIPSLKPRLRLIFLSFRLQTVLYSLLTCRVILNIRSAAEQDMQFRLSELHETWQEPETYRTARSFGPDMRRAYTVIRRNPLFAT